MPLSPTLKDKTRKSITSYAAYAVANEPRIHYSQARPFPFIDRIGTGWHTLDCSGFVVNCFWNASHDLETYIADPSGQKYSGWGNTWTLEAWLRQYGKPITTQPFLVGDIVRWGMGDHSHTAICTKRGTAKTARFTSHGKEAGPVVVDLHYRNDLVGVWRHPTLL